MLAGACPACLSASPSSASRNTALQTGIICSDAPVSHQSLTHHDSPAATQSLTASACPNCQRPPVGACGTQQPALPRAAPAVTASPAGRLVSRHAGSRGPGCRRSHPCAAAAVPGQPRGLLRGRAPIHLWPCLSRQLPHALHVSPAVRCAVAAGLGLSPSSTSSECWDSSSGC